MWVLDFWLSVLCLVQSQTWSLCCVIAQILLHLCTTLEPSQFLVPIIGILPVTFTVKASIDLNCLSMELLRALYVPYKHPISVDIFSYVSMTCCVSLLVKSMAFHISGIKETVLLTQVATDVSVLKEPADPTVRLVSWLLSLLSLKFRQSSISVQCKQGVFGKWISKSSFKWW